VLANVPKEEQPDKSNCSQSATPLNPNSYHNMSDVFCLTSLSFNYFLKISPLAEVAW